MPASTLKTAFDMQLCTLLSACCAQRISNIQDTLGLVINDIVIKCINNGKFSNYATICKIKNSTNLQKLTTKSR